MLWWLAGTVPAAAASVALVLAIDVSESVSNERYTLQHEGLARAFESSQLTDTITAVPGGIEVLVLEWSDPEKIAVTVGWTKITNRNAAVGFASASGDGMANFGVPPVTARDALVKAGITINGLAILSEEPWLDDYYRQNVIGGPASFCAVAEDFDSFADAILRKLIQEVASLPPRLATPDDAPT